MFKLQIWWVKNSYHVEYISVYSLRFISKFSQMCVHIFGAVFNFVVKKLKINTKENLIMPYQSLGNLVSSIPASTLPLIYFEGNP